jgi:hypothetical protein
MIIPFLCGKETHRLHVSRRGRITLLDYGADHRALDVLATLRGASLSECALVLRAVRARAFVPFGGEKLHQLFAEHAAKRRERRRVHAEWQNPVHELVRHELASCGLTREWYLGATGLQIDGWLYSIYPVEFLRCRRLVLGEHALRHGLAMSTYSQNGDHGHGGAFLMPLSLTRHATMRVLVLGPNQSYVATLSQDAFLQQRRANQALCAGRVA